MRKDKSRSVAFLCKMVCMESGSQEIMDMTLSNEVERHLSIAKNAIAEKVTADSKLF